MFSALPQIADIARSEFHNSANQPYCRSRVLRIMGSGSEQFHARLRRNNATRLAGMEWLCSANRAWVWVTGGSGRRSNRETNRENPPMRIYIIGNDGITLCRKVPATENDGEIAVASKGELHAAPLNGKRL